MKAAIVIGPEQAPIYSTFPEQAPGPGEVVVTVTAAAISHVTKSRAAGRHYSSKAAFPFVVGIDGVGRLVDGERVYFALPVRTGGSMAERTVVPAAHCAPVPDGLDDITAAAIANPGMSGWAALVERAQFRPGETVLVNGATGTAGRLAVQIARHLGAGRVIATGRDGEALSEVARLGAAETIVLGNGETAERLATSFASGVDVVLDYLWGASAAEILAVAAACNPEARPLRYVQIGAVSGAEITLPGAVLRSSAISLMGSGLGSVTLARCLACIAALLQAAVPAGLQIAATTVPLSEVAQAWPRDDSRRRTVFTVGAPA